MVVGETNSGKSSFINAFAGGYIANSSIQRETLQPTWYQFSSTVADNNNSTMTDIVNQLEACHINNENMRSDMSKLSEEYISTMNTSFTDDSKQLQLPPSFGLVDLSIIDFPGINESGDHSGNFFAAIANRISQVDMVIYVADAVRGFQYESEVQNFKKVRDMITTELDSGHFIDLIVVINKFDNVRDKDLNNIYARISKHIDYPTDKIFRCSSYRMLIANVRRNKRTLLVPTFVRPEINKILKGTGIAVSRELKRKLKSTGKISYEDLVYSVNIDSDDDDSENDDDRDTDYREEGETNTEGNNNDDSAGSDSPLDGDWDGLIGCIWTFQIQLEHSMTDNMRARILKFRKKYESTYVKLEQDAMTLVSRNGDPRAQDQHLTTVLDPITDELIHMHRIMHDHDIDRQMLYSELVDMVCTILDTYTAGAKMHFFIVHIVFQYLNLNFNIAATVGNVSTLMNAISIRLKRCLITDSTIRIVMLYGWNTMSNHNSLTDGMISPNKFVFTTALNTILLTVLQNPCTYGAPHAAPEILEYRYRDQKMIREYDKLYPTEYGTHTSWLITYLLSTPGNSAYTNKWKLLIKLSITRRSYLQDMFDNGDLPYNIIDNLVTSGDSLRMLRHYFNMYMRIPNRDDSQTPKNELFNLKSITKDFYDTYTNIAALVKKCTVPTAQAKSPSTGKTN